MKTLLLLRHAKSDWEADYGTDHQRPLSKRGRKAAGNVGRYLTETAQLPDVVIASDARRVKETLRNAQEAGAWENSSVVYTNDLYLAEGPEALIEVIRKAPAKVSTLMLVGHEPVWSGTVAALIGGGEIRFPTAALARIDLAVETWEEVTVCCGELVLLLPPRLLGRDPRSR